MDWMAPGCRIEEGCATTSAAMTALYSRYRSQRFDDLVGQDALVQTLKNALATGRVAHAYLFTGIRGTGKTSTARILAKAVNCLDPQDGEPCNRCASCVGISEGSATDLIEIDAASNRGIDEMRDLREKAKYMPALLKRKVYIIDEAHQLTPDAFNALLKTLEEPPEHVLFILCTTEAHKLPETVVSRCQRFEFRRIDEAGISGRLRHIAAAEAIAATDDGLALIAAMARGQPARRGDHARPGFQQRRAERGCGQRPAPAGPGPGHRAGRATGGM